MFTKWQSMYSWNTLYKFIFPSYTIYSDRPTDIETQHL